MSPALAKLLHARRSAQHLAGAQADDPHAAVRRLLAVQAQDYGAALWAVGLRTRAADAATVESAIAAGRVVRTWPMRGTLHFVAAEDVRWLQSLLAPRALARDSARHEREYGLDAKVLATCRRVLERALRDGGPVSRPALYEALETAGIATGNSRGLHILYRLATEGLICQGPRLGRQPGFVWQEAWLASSSALPRDAALAELGRRYLLGHGPATAHDLAWWSGLTLKDSQAALQAADAVPVEFDAGGARYWRLEDGPDGSSPARRDVLLLPAFDEYLLGYKDRTPVLDADHHRKVFTINGIIQPCVIAGSRVAGTWPRTVAGDFEPTLFRPLGEAERRGLRAAAKRHAGFWSGSGSS